MRRRIFYFLEYISIAYFYNIVKYGIMILQYTAYAIRPKKTKNSQ